LGPKLYANIIFNKKKISEIGTEIFRITEEHPNSIYEVWYYFIQWVVAFLIFIKFDIMSVHTFFVIG
jgi:hypothetical protein